MRYRTSAIRCREDSYLLELIRHIHLNPLRVGIVGDLKALDRYPHPGHSALMGKQQGAPFQDAKKISRLLGVKTASSRKAYRAFVEKGVALGRGPELMGGGWVRGIGGWKAANVLLQGAERVKGDERILGDSDFL